MLGYRTARQRRRAQQRAAQSPRRRGVKSGPQTVDQSGPDVRSLLGRHRGGTTVEAGTVRRARPAERRFEERLGGDRLAGGRLLIYIRVRVGEALTGEGSHVRHRVDVDQLILAPDDSSDVAGFDDDLLRKLALDGEVDRIGAVLLEF